MVGFSVSLYELVVGGADALEGLDQQNDDVGDNQLVLSLRQPVAMQFPRVLVVFQARPQLVDVGQDGGIGLSDAVHMRVRGIASLRYALHQGGSCTGYRRYRE